MLLRSQAGKPLILMEGFTFYQERLSFKSHYWRCTFRGCNARFVADVNNVITRSKIVHDHAAPQVYISNEIKFIQMEKGRRLLMDGFIFYRQPISSKNSEYWTCCRRNCLMLVRSITGKSMILLDGYKFYQARASKSTYSWRCSYRGCLSRVTTDLNNVVLQTKLLHNHDAPQLQFNDGLLVVRKPNN
ncbi:hypothetical protein EVAR_17914_1 [Eumeta japonica]|uniref:FLYWCH-type domain-containing protein n=1 Tax=Eumeta variegata TaxID=151549 RepID=A0A4C1UY79_EUMVA|nr:hypothetical protein EVAR_17914_1 [Eumeta japonica]